jgi:hypothetical protein
MIQQHNNAHCRITTKAVVKWFMKCFEARLSPYIKYDLLSISTTRNQSGRLAL